MNDQTITPRQRMLAAYEGKPSDRVPVAPEFWYYIPAKVLGVPMVELELEIPHWQALQHTFKHYQCEGWGIIAPEIPADCVGKRNSQVVRESESAYKETLTWKRGNQTLTRRRVLSVDEPSWVVERPVKTWETDWPMYEAMTLVPPETLDWSPVQQALDAVGEDYLLEVFVGFPFVDFIGEAREGGLEQVIMDLLDREADMLALQQRYITWMQGVIREAFKQTTARSIFIASSWSSMSLLSPRIWRKWEQPVLKAAVEAAHECGGLIHHHFHGRCMKVVRDLLDLGLDCICPWERPPGGDVTDLNALRELIADRVTFNGNVHTVETLIRGTPDDVRNEVLGILESFAGSSRLIVGTGDQVGAETPDENIQAMIATVKQYG